MQSPQAKLYKDRNFQIVLGVTLMGVLGVSSITPAFPRIVEELNISRTDVGMLITAFTLPGVFLSPFIGILADKFGRKRILLPSLFLFALAGMACALNQDFDTLVALRAVQGIGAAGLGALSLTILADLYSGSRRAEAMGLNASILSIGTASYPLIGGALATLAWNYPFFLPLAAIPIGIFALLGLHYPEPRSAEGLREYLGSAWGYMKNIRAIAAFMGGFIIFIILYGSVLTYLSLYLGLSFDAPPFIIGLILSSMSITTGIVSSQLGRMLKSTSATNLAKLGFVAYAVGLALLPFMPQLGLVVIPVIIFGLGMGLTVPTLQTYIAGLAPSEYRAAFMSINATMFWLGQTAGPLIFGLVYTRANFDGVFLYAAVIAAATAVIGFIGGKLIR